MTHEQDVRLVVTGGGGAGPVTARLSGEIDLTNCHRLAELLDAFVDASPTATIDLDGVGFLAACAARELIRAAQRAAAAGGALRFVGGAQVPGRMVLEAVGVPVADRTRV